MPEQESQSQNDARPVSWQVTADLLARYDRPGPRYTSYPTAVEFGPGVDAAVYSDKLGRADQAADAPLSIYVHLPFCEHRCLFCGCNVIISPDKERAAPYLELLRRELDMVAERLPHRRSLAQLHLGGGTPTYYSPEQLQKFLRDLLAVFRPQEPPHDRPELAVEVDPRVTTDEHIDVLAELGFNRISLGVQDFTPKVQETIERIQSVEMTAHLIEYARKRGFLGINVDLIYGLPFQDADSFAHTVDTVTGLKVDRSAVYSFAYVPWLHSNLKKLCTDGLPEREAKFRLFAVAREHFLRAGYEPIGMDHFARPDDELARARREGRLRRNFQGYSVIPADDVLGLGISAIGDIDGMYVQNFKKLSRYQAAVEAGELPILRGIALSNDDRIRRAVIHELMCNFAIDIPAVETAHGIDFAKYFAEDLALLAEHEREAAVTIGDERIVATPMGELFIRNLAMCFDRYQREKHARGDKQTFSRTV